MLQRRSCSLKCQTNPYTAGPGPGAATTMSL